MTTELENKLIRIGVEIARGTADYADLHFLQSHKQEVLNIGNPILCEQAGITEEEYNNGKLNPDLTYNKGIIKLEVDNDGEGNSFCKIVLEDKQELVVTQFELLELRNILNENIEELQEYFTQVAESVAN